MFNRHSIELITSGVFALLFTLLFVGAAVVPAEAPVDGAAHVLFVA